MNLSELITPERIVVPLRATSKKQVLQDLSAHAADETGLDARVIFDTLNERERLGTTGVGLGIAIPHGKVDNLDKLCGVFARLSQPSDFDSIDEQPVDLVFLLLAPSNAGAEHLKALAGVSRLLRDTEICDKLRGAENAAAIYALLTDYEDGAAFRQDALSKAS
jgi:PTS system nitrogen regulatory IIA component